MAQLTPIPLHQADLPFLDLESEAWLSDPWAEVHRIRAEDHREGRLALSRRGVEVLDYELYRRVSNDPSLGSLRIDTWQAQGAGPLLLDFNETGHLLFLEAERHHRVRQVMVRAFAHSKVDAQRGWFVDLANRLVDQFIASGGCNIVADFSHRYSIEILCHMIGVPAEDIEDFDRNTLEVALMHAFPLAPHADRVDKALQVLWDYASDIVARRRAAPADDFISALIAAQDTEGRLSEAEMVWNIVGLLFAGHDTTRYQLAATAMGVIQAGLWEELAEDPDLIPAAVAEGLRMWPVVHVTNRTVIEDSYVIDGISVPKGTILRMNWFAVHRDPASFEDPDRFNVHREDDYRRRLAFGGGVHKCIGHLLARADLEAGVEVLTQRLTDVRITAEVPWYPFNGGMGGPMRLPISFTARDA